MGEKMSARDAANAIRGDIAAAPSDVVNMLKFAEQVTRELGMDVTVRNVIRVAHSLEKHDIEPGIARYPKWVGKGDDGSGGVIVQSEAEEQEYLAKLEAASASDEPAAPNAPVGPPPVDPPLSPNPAPEPAAASAPPAAPTA